MNKIRVIDLLNKIANGEEVPEKIRYRYSYLYKDFKFDGGISNYISDKDFLFGEDITAMLNDEVEILEEEKKIPEKLDLPKKFEIGGCNVRIGSLGFVPTESVVIDGVLSKINDIIDHLDYLKSKGE